MTPQGRTDRQSPICEKSNRDANNDTGLARAQIQSGATHRVTGLRSAGDATPMTTKLAPGSAWKVG